MIDGELFERRYGYYLLRGIAAFGMLAGALALPFLLPDGWGWAALASLAIGFASIQAGILGHDAGHLAVCRRERTNAMIGQLCITTVLGVSFSFWRTRHNRHHTQTNDEEADPDLELGGLFTLNEDEAASQRGWRRLVTRYQASCSCRR